MEKRPPPTVAKGVGETSYSSRLLAPTRLVATSVAIFPPISLAILLKLSNLLIFLEVI